MPKVQIWRGELIEELKSTDKRGISTKGKIERIIYEVVVHFNESVSETVQGKLTRVVLRELRRRSDEKKGDFDQKVLDKEQQEKSFRSILVSAGARLASFDIQEVREITTYDELGLDILGDEETTLFLMVSNMDGSFNFLISMIYTLFFNLLYEKADNVYGDRLPTHVMYLIDEAANIGQIPNPEKLAVTIRSREVDACLVLQARFQLKVIYKDNADTIIGSMDSQIFLGGSKPATWQVVVSRSSVSMRYIKLRKLRIT